MELGQTESFSKWLHGLKDWRARERITARLAYLAKGHWGDAKPIGEGVHELRVHIGPGYRIYLAKRGDVAALLLAGGDKSSQRRDIERAKVLAAEWRRQWD